MIVLYDTNVLLDFLIDREPFNRDATAAWAAAEMGLVRAYVSALSIATVYYVARRRFDKAVAAASVEQVRRVYALAAVNARTVADAVAADFPISRTAFRRLPVRTPAAPPS